jgi:hypothetical protein
MTVGEVGADEGCFGEDPVDARGFLEGAVVEGCFGFAVLVALAEFPGDEEDAGDEDETDYVECERGEAREDRVEKG